MVMFDCAPQTWLAPLETDSCDALETVRHMFRHCRIAAGLQGSLLTDSFSEVVTGTASATASAARRACGDSSAGLKIPSSEALKLFTMLPQQVGR